MNKIQRFTRQGIGLGLAVALASGCANGVRAPEAEQRDAPPPTALQDRPARGDNPGGKVAMGCARGAVEFLRAGFVGVPFSVGILVVCLPIAAAAAVIHEVVPVNDGSGAPSFSYPSGRVDGCADRRCELGAQVNERSGAQDFAYPSTSSFGACPDGRCGVGSHLISSGASDFYPNSYRGHYRR